MIADWAVSIVRKTLVIMTSSELNSFRDDLRREELELYIRLCTDVKSVINSYMRQNVTGTCLPRLQQCLAIRFSCGSDGSRLHYRIK